MPYKWGSDLGQVKCCEGHAKRINLWPSLVSGLCIFKTHNDCLFIVLTCRIIDRISIHNCKRRKSPDFFFLTFTFLSLNWKSTEVLFAGLMEENSVSSIGKIQLEYSKHYHISLHSCFSRDEGDQNRLGWVDRHCQTISALLLWLLSGVYVMHSTETTHTLHYWDNTQIINGETGKNLVFTGIVPLTSRQCLSLSATCTRKALHRI